MSFVEAIYTATIEINKPDINLYEKIRVRLIRHPSTSLLNLSARLVTYLHCYRTGLELYNGQFKSDQAEIYNYDVTGALTNWIAVGAAHEHNLRHLVKQNPRTYFAVYFYDHEQIEKFCHILRGSTSNWVEKINFFFIDPELISNFAELLKSSNTLTATVLDYSLYLSIEKNDLVGIVNSINIWQKYQISIGNLT